MRDQLTIRGDNPPAIHVERSTGYNSKARLLRAEGFILFSLLFILSGFIIFEAFSFGGLFLWGIASVAIVYVMIKKHDEYSKLAEQFSPPLPLHAFNTEFLAPLADRTGALITVHFQVPSDRAQPRPDGPREPRPAELVEQLNRVTENLLIPFCLPFTEPPTRTEIEDVLRARLVQFQHDHNVLVLRVNVPLVIHKIPEPEKPKGVYV